MLCAEPKQAGEEFTDGLAGANCRAAEKVRRWGEIVELEPMTAFDRRIVHTALKDDPDITTQSVEVDGTNKKVILLRPRNATSV